MTRPPRQPRAPLPTDRGPVALVTGASSGLGEGLARRLAAEGWAVGLSARRADALNRVREEIENDGGRAEVLPCDVGSREEVRDAVRRCVAALGPVDLLVCNAGISTAVPAAEFSSEAFERVLRVNAMGAAHAIDAVLPSMLARDRGHLVGMGSQAGFGGLPRSAAYSASKAALHNLFESLRVELRPTGVDVTLLVPGWVRTPLTDRNDHRMPFLMELEPALDRMMAALRRREPQASFPWPMASATWLGRLLPRRLYDLFASRIRRSKRPEA